MPRLFRAAGDRLVRSIERKRDEVDVGAMSIEEARSQQITGCGQRHFETLRSGVLDQRAEVGPLHGIAAGEHDAAAPAGGDLGDDGEGGGGVDLGDTLRPPAIGTLLAAL